MSLLVVEDLAVDYGPAQALFGISLEVEAGQSVAVLGANGAGKSTLAKALAGLVRPVRGRIRFDGRDITGWPAHRVGPLGLAYLPEERGIFPKLSVTDNLRMFARAAPSASARRDSLRRSFDMFPALAQRRAQRAGTLSGGEQQMLALVRVLSSPPRVIIADEPSLGLAPMMIDAVFAALSRARDEGASIIVIEQFVHRALAFADTCVVLQRGRLAWSGPAAAAGTEALSGYLGEAAAADGRTD